MTSNPPRDTKPEVQTFDEGVYMRSSFRTAVADALEAHRFEAEHFAAVRAFDDQPSLLRHTIPTFVEENIELHVGWFRDTLPGFASTLTGQIGFIHCDADLYSSTRLALETLSAHIGPGTALLFDEYWNFSGCYEHECRAFREFIAGSGLRFRYLGYNRNYTQASVMLLAGE